MKLFWTIFCSFFLSALGLWTKYNFVRNRKGAFNQVGGTSFVKINSVHNNGPPLSFSYGFGCSVANMGDIDGNGVSDLAVGSKGEPSISGNTTLLQAGAVYILFMDGNGTVASWVRIAGGENGAPFAQSNAMLGYSLANIGDLDGDGMNELAVGAPGTWVPNAYVLFLHRNGTVRDSVLVRGKFISIIVPNPNNASDVQIIYSNTTGGKPNGPPVLYNSYYGSSMAPMGDLDDDGIPDFAVGSSDSSGGNSKLYLLYMNRDATVKNWVIISQGTKGFPKLKGTFLQVGSSISVVGDLNGDGIKDIAIGAMGADDDVQKRSGAVYVCMMNKDGSIQSYSRISEISGLQDLPLLTNENCGASVLGIGDLNQDHMRQQHPTKPAVPSRPSIPDLLVGCPQGNTPGGAPGRIFAMLLNQNGQQQVHIEFPTKDEAAVGFQLHNLDQFGSAMSLYEDYQGTGIKGIVVGAPGDKDSGAASGAVYIIYIRRKRFHKPIPCTECYYGLRVGIAAIVVTCVCSSCIAFFYYFRRRPDEVEIAVKKGGLEITRNRQRKKMMIGRGDAAVYADSYTV